MKRTISMLLALLLCLSLLPAALASGELPEAEAMEAEPMEADSAEAEAPEEDAAGPEAPEAEVPEEAPEVQEEVPEEAQPEAPAEGSAEPAEEPALDGADPYALISSVWADSVDCTDNDLAADTGYYDENDRWVEVGHPWRIDCMPGQVTVKLTDGRQIQGTPYEVWEQVSAIFGEDIPFGWTSDETPDATWGLGSHSAYFIVGSKYYQFRVFVQENPIASVTAENVRRLTTDTYYSYWYDEDGSVSGPYEFINGWPDQITVTTKNGAVYTGTPAKVQEKLNKSYSNLTRGIGFSWVSDALDPDSLWGVGEYPAVLSVNGVTADYTVTVIDDPIASVAVADVTRFASDLSAWTEYFDADRGAWVEADEPWRIDCAPYDVGITVTTADGSTYTGDPADIAARLEEIYDCVFDYGWYTDQEGPADAWGLGTHTAYFWFAGAETDYAVTVVEAPIASVAVADMARFNTEVQNAKSGALVIDCTPRDEEITVTLKDGRVFRGTASEVWDALEEALGMRVTMTWDSDELHGTHWHAGAHTATLYVCGVGGEFNVNVVNNPVEHIFIGTITRRLTDLSDWTEYYDEERGEWVDPGYRWRIDCMPEVITVSLYDGKTLVGDPYEIQAQIEELCGVRPLIRWEMGETYNQETKQYEEPTPTNPWGLGNYTAEFHFGGAVFLYYVTVLEDFDQLFQSVEAEDITVFDTDRIYAEWYDEKTGETSGPYHMLDLMPDHITVTTAEGGVYEGEPYEVYDKLSHAYGAPFTMYWDTDEVPDENWGPGEYTVKFVFEGHETEFTASVIENPIENVTAAPISVPAWDRVPRDGYYDAEGAWVEEAWEAVDCAPERLTVTLKDGTVFTCGLGELTDRLRELYPGLRLDPQWTSDERPDALWTAGEHEAALVLAGVEYPYAVTVGGEGVKPTVTLDKDGKTAHITGDTYGVYARVALVLSTRGMSGLYVTQAEIAPDGTIAIPAFNVPGLTVLGVNLALVQSLEELMSPTPVVVAMTSVWL